MRIIFMGTPDFAVHTLKALHDAGHDIICVYTQPPRRAGRGKQLRPTPVHDAAAELGLEVRHPPSLKDADAQAEFLVLDADAAVVVAYGLILPQAVLDGPRLGCFNVHASLLPRWRGAAPIQRAILAGDELSGVTIMQMELGLDTGPMLAKSETAVDRMTTGELHDVLAASGAVLMVDTLAQIETLAAQTQDDALAIYAPKIDKAEARIDWSKPADVIEREIRAFAPFPGSWFELEGERIKLLLAEVSAADNGENAQPGTAIDDALLIACGSGQLRAVTVQRAGKPAMAVDDFLRGRPVAAGTLLA